MSFRRTEMGLSNLYLFFGVEAVVYLEGGNSYCREDVDRGMCTEATQDIRYWQAIFNVYRSGKTYKFCSIGSKQVVKSIAADIKEGKISNVVVAMDRDFDHINGKLISSDNIIYTNGYSWENDAWNEVSIRETFCALSGACKTMTAQETEIIEKYFKECTLDLRGATRIDAVLSQYDKSLFDRDSYKRYVQIEKSVIPKVNREQIMKSISNARQENGRPILRKSPFVISTLIDCFGHLFAEISYRILAYLLEKVRGNPKLPKDYATSMVVEKFAQLLANGLLPELKQHYSSEFARVTP